MKLWSFTQVIDFIMDGTTPAQVEEILAEQRRQFEEWDAQYYARQQAEREYWERVEAQQQRQWDAFFDEAERILDGDVRPAREVYRQFVREFHPDRHQGRDYTPALTRLVQQANQAKDDACTLNRLRRQAEALVN